MAQYATQEQLDRAERFHREQRERGLRYDWQHGTWVEPPRAPPAPEEPREIDDHRDESNEDFEGFLTELKLTTERPVQHNFVRNAQARLNAVRKQQEVLDWTERSLRAEAAAERDGDFYRRVADVQSKVIKDESEER